MIRVALLVPVAWTVGACGGGAGDTEEDGGDGDDGATDECNPDEFIDWEGNTYVDTVGGPDSLLPCDPQVAGVAFYEDESIVGETLESVAVSLAWGTLPPANNTYRGVALRVGGPGVPLEQGVAYPMTQDQSESFFTAQDATADEQAPRLCNAESGEATVTQLGAEGEFIRGNYTVTAWVDNDPDCPAPPVSGEFQVLREN